MSELTMATARSSEQPPFLLQHSDRISYPSAGLRSFSVSFVFSFLFAFAVLGLSLSVFELN